MITKINVPEEIVKKIELYDIQYHSRQEIITELLKTNNINFQDLLLEYQKDYDEKYFLFQKEKQQLENLYVLPNINSNNYTWNLNYYTNILTIYDNETI